MSELMKRREFITLLRSSRMIGCAAEIDDHLFRQFLSARLCRWSRAGRSSGISRQRNTRAIALWRSNAAGDHACAKCAGRNSR